MNRTMRGRRLQAAIRANDQAHWHTRMETPAPEDLERRLRVARVDWVSPGMVRAPGGADQTRVGLHMLDPDGHVVLVVGEGERREQNAPSGR